MKRILTVALCLVALVAYADTASQVDCTTCIDSGEIAANAVGASEITDGSVGAAELGTDSVGSDEIATDAVGAAEIAAGAVGTSEIATDGVAADEIAAGAVGASEIATDAVAADEIAADAVGTSELNDGADSPIRGESVIIVDGAAQFIYGGASQFTRSNTNGTTLAIHNGCCPLLGLPGAVGNSLGERISHGHPMDTQATITSFSCCVNRSGFNSDTIDFCLYEGDGTTDSSIICHTYTANGYSCDRTETWTNTTRTSDYHLYIRAANITDADSSGLATAVCGTEFITN